MFRSSRPSLVLLVWLLAAPSSVWSTDPIENDPPSHGTDASGSPSEENEELSQAATHAGPACIATDNFFADEVWAKVGEQTCLKCHHRRGDAAESALVLQDPARDPDRTAEALAENRAALARLALTTNLRTRTILSSTSRRDCAR